MYKVLLARESRTQKTFEKLSKDSEWSVDSLDQQDQRG